MASVRFPPVHHSATPKACSPLRHGASNFVYQRDALQTAIQDFQVSVDIFPSRCKNVLLKRSDRPFEDWWNGTAMTNAPLLPRLLKMPNTDGVKKRVLQRAFVSKTGPFKYRVWGLP